VPGAGGPGNQPRRFEAPAPPPGRFVDPDAERIASIRRPRLYDAEGNPQASFMDAEPFDRGAILQARKRGAVFSDARHMGEPVRVFTTSAERFGDGWMIQVAREVRDYRELARVQWLTLLTVLPFAIAAATLGGRFLTARAMRPMRDMAESAAKIGQGAFDQRIEVQGDDEFALLGAKFNDMAESLGVSFAGQRAAYAELEKSYERQKRFVADASHELRTPLTRLQLATSAALEDPSSDARRALKTADDSARAMARLIGQLLDLARADSGELKPKLEDVDLRALTADVVDGFAAPEGKITLSLPEHAANVRVDRGQIERALINLLDNALRHGKDSPVRVTVEDDAVVVEDSGEGISPSHLPRVKERFYRVDPSRTRDSGGSGLGLSIADEIMRAHGGRLVIESEPEKGTKATLAFEKNPQSQTISSP
jgi:signal transduction histidine kinase